MGVTCLERAAGPPYSRLTSLSDGGRSPGGNTGQELQ